MTRQWPLVGALMGPTTSEGEPPLTTSTFNPADRRTRDGRRVIAPGERISASGTSPGDWARAFLTTDGRRPHVTGMAGLLAVLAGDDGTVRASIADLAEASGNSHDTARTALRDLRRAGWVERQPGADVVRLTLPLTSPH